jgi:AraC-like DNA-binding protein
MKIQREIVSLPEGQSFRIFSPRLRNYFYWHYHPEFELTFVEATTGMRHVGQHISGYMESDLILIGPNIPHLNFDYGLKTEYRQIVVQMKEDLLGDAFARTPEFKAINELLQRAAMAISFGGRTKTKAAILLQRMQSMNHFDQLMCLLEILQLLARSNDYELLNDQDTSVRTFLKDKVRMSSVYEYIHSNYNKEPDVNRIASKVSLSTAAFCRYFRKQTKMTFTDFVNQYRVNQAKTHLLHDMNVSETAYAVGFESLSYFNKVFKRITRENPSEFKKKNLKYQVTSSLSLSPSRNRRSR